MKFPIVIHKDKDSDYGVCVPDLPGCFSAGTTLDEALENAREAIECHIEGLLNDGEALPKTRPIEVHHANDLYAEGIWALVEVDVSKLSGRAKRVNITLPERILRQIDDCAGRTGNSRSGLLAQAAMEFIAASEHSAL